MAWDSEAEQYDSATGAADDLLAVAHRAYGTGRVLADIRAERRRQDQKWGVDQTHPDGTGHPFMRQQADNFRAICDARFADGRGAWLDILLEEVYEAIAESDAGALRKELVQVAAVCTGWIEDIDTRA